MSNVRRFIPKAERIAKERADEFRQAVLDFGLPETATEDILITIQRHESGGKLAEWNFNMISPAQCLVVWNAIKQGPAPNETRDVFDYVLTHIETNTGIVTLTREELAECVGTHPNNISRAMKRLEDIGAVVRERVKVPGMRGPGKARYRLNPHVAWNGQLEKRKHQAEQTPLPFEVLDGGKNTQP